MTLSESVTIFLAGLTLLVTFAIAFLAIRISSDFASLKDGHTQLGHRIDRADRVGREYSIQSGLLLVVASEFYRTNALLSAYFKKVTEIDHSASPEQTRAYNLLIAELERRNSFTVENIDLLKVLVNMNELSVKTLLETRPTKRTLWFLVQLAKVAPPSLNDYLDESIESLTLKVLEVDSSLWTGRGR